MSSSSIDWSEIENFKEDEFRCSHTGLVFMHPQFVFKLQTVRTNFGKPMRLTSAYRHSTHPDEVDKDEPGTHAYGCAVDVGIANPDAWDLARVATDEGFSVGVSQRKGRPRFLHLDMRELVNECLEVMPPKCPWLDGDGYLSPRKFPGRSIWSY